MELNQAAWLWARLPHDLRCYLAPSAPAHSLRNLVRHHCAASDVSPPSRNRGRWFGLLLNVRLTLDGDQWGSDLRGMALCPVGPSETGCQRTLRVSDHLEPSPAYHTSSFPSGSKPGTHSIESGFRAYPRSATLSPGFSARLIAIRRSVPFAMVADDDFNSPLQDRGTRSSKGCRRRRSGR
jgi:hypothetical protein